MITYRNAQDGDKKAFGDLEREYYKTYESLDIDSFLEPLPYQEMPEEGLTASFETFLNSENFFYVAESDGDVIGYVYAEIKKHNHESLYKVQEYGYINTIVVSESYRGHGVGKTLLTMAIDWFKSKSIRACVLEAMKENQKAVSFYESFGFQIGNMKMWKEL
ncbi:MAG: GNAT family N-acetyltransferase [Candidatus Pacebacteria bacterium]|nr:GNAT family N-acetyltransferase [Candidatus Paceibacterota bacterium]